MLVELKRRRAEYSQGNGAQHAGGLDYLDIAYEQPDMARDLPCVLDFVVMPIDRAALLKLAAVSACHAD